MQVSVESTSALERRMTIQVPAEQVDREVENRLSNLVRTVRLDGFRPGKVPLKVVKRKFGPQVRLEVMEQVINSSLSEALAQEQLQPAGQPKLELPEGADNSANLEFTATFEVYPEISIGDFSGVSIEKPVVTLGDADLDGMLNKLRQQRVVWETVERPAQNGDRVVIDFTGTIDGEAFDGGSASNVPLELGSNSMIPGFEEQLVGVTPGEERTLDVSFPEDYTAAQLAGKAAQFAVKVISVSAPQLPELDDAFAANFGMEEGGIEALRTEVRSNMEREMEQAVRATLKERVFDAVLKQNPISVPSSLVSEEIERAGQDKAAPAMSEETAQRRVALGLLIGEIVKQNQIQLDHERVRSMVETMAASYENPAEVVAWYYENQQMMNGVQAMVMEDQVVDWLLDKIDAIEKTCTFEELLASRR